MSVFESQSRSGWHPLNLVNLKVMADPRSTFSLVDVNWWSHYQLLLLVVVQSVRHEGQLALQLYPSQRQTVPRGRERLGRCVLEIPSTHWVKIKMVLSTGWTGTQIKITLPSLKALEIRSHDGLVFGLLLTNLQVVWGNISRASNARTKSGFVLNLDHIVVQIWHKSESRLDPVPTAAISALIASGCSVSYRTPHINPLL